MPDRRQKVLIADDDPEVLSLLVEVLQPDGYWLLVARNAQEAINLALAHAPDLMLLDVVMPGGGGYEICDELRAQVPDQQLAVIFLTAMDETVEINKGFAAGAVDYITK